MEPIKEMLKNGIMPVLKALGDHVGTTFRYIQLDSHECGNHTWGAIMPELFRRLHGYEILPWLPALTGRVVGSHERTERFMRDYRKALEVGWNEGFAKPMSENAGRPACALSRNRMLVERLAVSRSARMFRFAPRRTCGSGS